METSFDQLQKEVYQGATEKFDTIDDNILDKLNLELSIIEQLNLSYYFLNYKIIVDFCNKEGWLCSPGRGFATASMVNYCLDITKLNPLENGLYFERFINSDHFKGIDIDMDLPKGKRNILINYLQENFHDSTIRQFISPATDHSSLPERYIHNGEEYARHPWAVIITPVQQLIELDNLDIGEEHFWIVKDWNNDRKLIDQHNYDILELDYLNVIQEVTSKLDESEQPYSISTQDALTFKGLIKGENENVFQFSSPDLKPILKAYKPSSILDLAIINAVFRPGAFDKIPKVVHHKMYGYESTFRSDIRVEQILKETFGVLIFQETFLDIATQIAGFEATEAEYYLRILSRRKNQEKIDLFKKLFKEGCKIHSTLTSSEIELLATMMLKDGSRTFMKSHSLSYSMIGYWGAYYKTHFGKEFENFIALR